VRQLFELVGKSISAHLRSGRTSSRLNEEFELGYSHPVRDQTVSAGVEALKAPFYSSWERENAT
jgi:hypothetical protein